jgi:deoxyhypusine synthase
MARQQRRIYGPKIDPRPVDPSITVVELIEQTFLSYNAGRLREAAQLFSRRLFRLQSKHA